MEILFKILMLTAQGGTQLNDCIFSTTESDKFNQLLNKTKTNIIEIFYSIVKFYVKNHTIKQYSVLALYINMKDYFVKEMIKSLFSLIDHERTTIDQIEEIDHLKECVYQC